MKISSHIEKQLIDNILDPIVLTDKDRIIEYANKAAIQLYGYSLEELRGKHVNIFDAPGNEMPDKVREIMLEKGKWSGDIVRRKKDGTIFNASMNVFSIFNEDGTLIGYAGNTRDITETVTITDALIEKQHQLKSIFDNTADIIASIDRDLNVVEFNPVLAQRIKLGFNHDLKRGDAMLNYIDPSKHEIFKALYVRVFKGERLTDIEIFKGRNGDSLYFETSYNPIIDEHKGITGISIFSKEITLRVKNENALIKASEEKDLLLSEIHHRIKNNLAIISSVLQLQAINTNNDEAIRCLRDSRLRIKSAALLHEMLYQNNSLDKVEVKNYLNEMFKSISSLTDNKEHNLVITGDDVSLLIHNAIPVGMLFNEIFTNSIKHGFKSVAQGEIVINIGNKDKLTTFELTENAALFPQEIDIETSHSTGLSLIKNFTEQLNGTIQLVKKPKTKYLLSLDLT